MQVFRNYLDGLPKINYDRLKYELGEGDTIYRIVGNAGDFGNMNVLKMGTGTHGGLSVFCAHPQTKELVELPTELEYVLYNLETGFEQIRKRVDVKHFPLLEQDETQRKLAVQKGELSIRYILRKKDGTEYEILT